MPTIAASEDVVARSMATAAAALILPSEVEALGVAVAPDAAPPFAHSSRRRSRAAPHLLVDPAAGPAGSARPEAGAPFSGAPPTRWRPTSLRCRFRMRSG